MFKRDLRDSFKRFNEKKLSDKECFYKSVRDKTIDHNGEKLDNHISDEDYLMCTKIWNQFNMGKKWVIITIIIWKKMFCY